MGSALPDGTVVVAVADGLGSAAHSDSGAQLAVKTAGETVERLLRPPVGSNSESESPEATESLKSAVRGGAEEARRGLEALAEDNGWELREVACTLIVLAARPRELAVAHIGDGAAVAETETGLVLVSDPGESEYANEVTPLTAVDWEQALRLAALTCPVRSVAVFTDGCQRAALRRDRDGYHVFDGFLAPLLSYASTVVSSTEGGEDVRRLLESEKMAANSEDDKTLVFGVLAGCQQEDALTLSNG